MIWALLDQHHLRIVEVTAPSLDVVHVKFSDDTGTERTLSLSPDEARQLARALDDKACAAHLGQVEGLAS